MVGLLGLPHNASYALTKGAIRSFTESLRAELITSGVGVTAVFPGSIRTAITDSARGTHGSLIARLGRHPLSRLVLRTPETVAKRIVTGVENGRARIVVGADAHLVDLFARLVPGRSGLLGRITSRLVR
jgi:short-subunit dehydrogenase